MSTLFIGLRLSVSAYLSVYFRNQTVYQIGIEGDQDQHTGPKDCSDADCNFGGYRHVSSLSGEDVG